MSKKSWVALICILSLSNLAFAYDAKEVISLVNLEYSPVNEKSSFKMTLIDAGGKSTDRTGTQYFKRKESNKPESMRLYRFHSPPEMAKSAVLIIENSDKDNDQWIYLPATYSTRKIPSRNRGDRYMGTDFSYEDAVSYKISEYSYKALEDETINNTKCHKIEQIPIDPKLVKESLYSRIKQWIDPARSVAVKREYYDKANNLLKIYKASDFVKVGGLYRARHVEMEDLKLKHKTIVDYSNFDTTKVIKDSYFTVRSLERPE